MSRWVKFFKPLLKFKSYSILGKCRNDQFIKDGECLANVMKDYDINSAIGKPLFTCLAMMISNYRIMEPDNLEKIVSTCFPSFQQSKPKLPSC